MNNDVAPLYQIRNWNDNFENAKSRSVKECSFVCIPNKQGGVGLMHILAEPDGRAIYGLWTLILEMCSHQKPPREGYLTADGKRNGRRYRAAEIACLFRASEAEVRRFLAVVSAPEVDWLELVEGPPEENSAISASNTAQSAQVPDAIPQYSAPDTKVSRKKEGKNERNSLSKGSEIVNTPASASDDLIEYAEAKQLFGELSLEVFDRALLENQWPYDMEHWLDQILPLKRAEWELVHWFYHLPDDHEVFELTYRRQSIAALIEKWGRELEKIHSVRKKLGVSRCHAEPATPQPRDEWTEKRLAAFQKMFPGCDPWPFYLLGSDLRERIDRVASEIT